MFVSPIRPEARTWAEPTRSDAPIQPMQPTCRGEHARLLAIAAARRLRAAERAAHDRPEDADYWKAVAPAAVHKAEDLRRRTAFAPLPG